MATDSRPPLGDLDENDLAATTMAVVDRVRPHLGTILMVVAILFVALAAWVFVRTQNRSEQARAWDDLFRAMQLRDSGQLQAIADSMPEEPAGIRALIALGDMALTDGNGLLMRNPERARGRLEDAAEFYARVNAARPQGTTAERGVLGLARAREGLGELEEARLGYEALLEEYPDSPYASLAEERIAALSRPATERWYDWLESRATDDRPSTEAAQPPSAPGSEPSESAADAEPAAG